MILDFTMRSSWREYTFFGLSLVAFASLCSNVVSAVRLNEVQLLGTHNSYHVAPNSELGSIRSYDPRLGVLLDTAMYSHPSIYDQLQYYGVRALEFDFYDDFPQGGAFAWRGLRTVLNLNESFDDAPEMSEPGFKCLHIDNVDYETHCRTLTTCLETVKIWSDDNPSHVPLVLRIEMKTRTMIEVLETSEPQVATNLKGELKLVAPTAGVPDEFPRTDPPISSNTTLRLLDAIKEALGPNLLTPDDLRGEHLSMRDALQKMGKGAFWPELDSVRGKIIVVVGGVGGYVAELYGSGLVGSPVFTRFFLEPSSQGSVLDIPADVVFVEHYSAGTSAFIQPLAVDGFFIIGFADLRTAQARKADYSTYDEVTKAGVNVVLTEFLKPSFTQYSVSLPCEEGQVYCVLPSNNTAPPRMPPDESEQLLGPLKPVPQQVEQQFPPSFDVGRSPSFLSSWPPVAVAIGLLLLF